MARESDEIRREVSKAYAEAVKRPARSGCCGSAPARKGAVVSFAGYTTAQLETLPDDAAVNSFGCGNPVAFAGIGEGQVVLDLGSGAGIDLILAAQQVGPRGHVIGIDMTDEMIERATKNIRESKLENVEVRKGIIEELPVQSGSIDWVISNCVINLSPEKAKVFGEIARVLKPGGQLLISDIVAKDLPEELRKLADLYSACVGGAISEDAYLAGLREAGLTDVEVRARLIYDADQLVSLVSLATQGACGCAQGKELAPAAARALAGKVWSAKVYARRPD